MDGVYKLYNKNASQKVHIKEYYDEYRNLITSADCLVTTKPSHTDLMDVMGVQLGEDEMNMLSSYCRYYNY